MFTVSRQVASYCDPIETYIGELRHLAIRDVALRSLRDIHKHTLEQSQSVVDRFVGHILLGVDYHFAIAGAPEKVRPVLMYYSFLNFASATILAYRPDCGKEYKSHGVSDLSRDAFVWELESPAVKLGNSGAVPIFDELFSAIQSKNRSLSLLSLFAALPWVSVELLTHFKQNLITISLQTTTSIELGEASPPFCSVLKCFSPIATTEESNNQIEHLLSMAENFSSRYAAVPDQFAVWKSNQHFQTLEELEADESHRRDVLQFVNFGSITRASGFLRSKWSFVDGHRPVSTLTATLCLSHFLSSVYRYRADLVHSVEASPIHFLVQTFIRETPLPFIASIRDLLYRSHLSIGQMIR